MMSLGPAEAIHHQAYLLPGRGDTTSRRLLERVENVDGMPQLDRVDRTVGVAIMILNDFEDASTAKPLKRLRVWMTIADLRQVQSKTSCIFDVVRKLSKIISGGANEEERVHF
jgi:hypothetical protein